MPISLLQAQLDHVSSHRVVVLLTDGIWCSCVSNGVAASGSCCKIRVRVRVSMVPESQQGMHAGSLEGWTSEAPVKSCQ